MKLFCGSAVPKWLALLVLGFIQPLGAVDFQVRVVDGLNRPLPGVLLELSCYAAPNITLLEVRSDRNGIARGKYKLASAECEQSKKVAVQKEGYETYGTGFRPRYVLRREFGADEVHRIAKLEGDAQLRALRELLGGQCSREYARFRDLVFYYEGRLRPMLRALVHDPIVTVQARDSLALIGVPEDLRLIMQLAPPPKDDFTFSDRWRYDVATALINPDMEEEWSFLRSCALNKFDDRWVDAGAIQSLQLNASPRSQAILEEAQKRNAFRSPRIARALEYLKSNSGIPADEVLEKLASRVAQAIKIGTWLGNSKPRYNEAGEKALVDFHFHQGSNGLIYTATFHKVNGVWTLRGARETYQAFVP